MSPGTITEETPKCTGLSFPRFRHADLSSPSRNSGFTLLEILVSLAIMGIAITVVMQLFSANLRNLATSEDYVSAAAKAEAKMREVLDNDKLSESSMSETTNDGYRMDVLITRALDKRTETLQVVLLEVNVTLRWTSGAKDKALTLKTLKTVEKQI
jgi:prepilin-type N-terminal cleavage/methylation domain-containing protein